MAASARCVEFVQTPLAPLREILEQLGRRERAARDPSARELLARLAFERRPEMQAGWLPEGSLFDSIDGSFARYALRGTLVLTIEDVHWADRSTLAFLAFCADRIKRRRMLVVATYRADEMDARHPHLSEFSALLSKEAVSTISVPPLGEGAMRTLIDRSTKGSQTLPAATIAEIVRRSQGNAFFGEELVKSAVDAMNDDGLPELPLSIRAAVLARAAQLGKSDRDIVSLAAVLGERFAVAQLLDLAEAERETVLLALERARALNLLYDEPTAPGEIAFRHALTQEVLYGELLAERVRPLHEAIARELETKPNAKGLSVQLAHHWRRAGDLQRASAYDEAAGDNAFFIGAFADAILYYERALAGRPRFARLEHKLGVAFGSVIELQAGIERLQRAGDLYWQAGDFEGYAENASALVSQLYNRGDVAAATAACYETIEALHDKLAPEKLDLIRARLAFQCIAALDDESASAFLNQIAEPIDDPKVAMHASWNRSRVAAMRGEIERWRHLAGRALDAARRLEDNGSWVRFLNCQIALDALGVGDVAAAREHFGAAAPPKPQRRSLQATLLSAASAFEHTLRGDFAAAAELLREPERLSVQSYPILVHVKSASLALGICSGDEVRLRHDDIEALLSYGLEHGMKVAVGLLSGPYAWALGVRGEQTAAADWIERIAPALPGPHRFLFAYLAAAQFGRAGDVVAMRTKLAAAAGRPQDRVNKAVLGLFDAYAAERKVVKADRRTPALVAATEFEAIGWPWLAARAYEFAGESRRALDLYRSLGCVRDVQRLEVETSDAPASVLSLREREVADLVAQGHSNDEIAGILHISARTAEKHVSSALKKLNLRSRVQLGRALARSGR